MLAPLIARSAAACIFTCADVRRTASSDCDVPQDVVRMRNQRPPQQCSSYPGLGRSPLCVESVAI
ncbi:hypothetical protein XFF6992_460076 [Xanthomonas citri pv. fuscans]|nr:hypothetical protein XFF6992_460076 [Xanthomonas citri pv. fuscans]